MNTNPVRERALLTLGTGPGSVLPTLLANWLCGTFLLNSRHICQRASLQVFNSGLKDSQRMRADVRVAE